MKIANSGVTMASSREYESHVTEEKTSLTLQVNDEAAKEAFTSLRGRVDSYEASITQAVREFAQSARFDGAGASGQAAQASGQSVQASAQSVQISEQRVEVAEQRVEASRGGPETPCADLLSANVTFSGKSAKEEFQEMQANVLKKMLAVLHGLKDTDSRKLGEMSHGRVLDLRSASYKSLDIRAQLFGVNAEGAPQSGTMSAGTVWRRVTETSVTHSEHEATAFQSQGFAVTEDGRTLHFDVSFAMSRDFTQSYEALREEEVVMTDPLIINLDNNPTSVSDWKFDFDLDGDGQKENVSFAGEGSGFLALDANGNGVIDDGSELFGTKSGDGFADLAAYDDDGNGWIDENDAVYDKLRVWTRDADGNEKLMGLQEADVGAIYLDSANTEFSLNDARSNETNGIIRKTGVYLKESGGAGTLSHVDLRC